MAGIAVVVVCVLFTVVRTGRSHTPGVTTTPGRTSPASTATAAVPSPGTEDPVAADGCTQHPAGPGVWSGTAPGGTTSGQNAIFGFERAFYVTRTGTAAAGFLLDGGAAADNTEGQHWRMDAVGLQRGIDRDLPVGTRYCVLITLAAGVGGQGDQQWEVRVTRQPPDLPAQTFTQVFTTTTTTSATLISAIHSN